MQLRFAFLILVAISSCTPKSWQYGNIIDHGKDPFDQKIILTIPDNAPSIERRFRLLDSIPSDMEQGGAFHEGIDLSGEVGLPILAVADGDIKISEFDWFWGNYIIIDHGKDEEGRYLQTSYAHMDNRYASAGDRVARGQHIGDLGAAGKGALVPHLHYEVHVSPNNESFDDRRPINPNLLWMDGVGKITCFDPDRIYPTHPLRFTYPGKCKKN